MNFPLIGRSNPLLKSLKRLDTPQERLQSDSFLVEGLRVVGELALSSLVTETLIISQEAGPEAVRLAEKLALLGAKVYCAEPEVLQKVSSANSSQGLLAVARLPHFSPLQASQGGRLLVLQGVQDPGNVGTLIRSGLAFGANGAIVCGGADPFNARAVRASAGAVFHMPVVRMASEQLSELTELITVQQALPIITAEAHDGQALNEVIFPAKWALVLGAEVEGVPISLQQRASIKVTIPLEPASESLNVAAAGAVLLYEMARQRI